MSGWLYALITYMILDTLGLAMLAGKRVRYTWPLVTLCGAVNLMWIVVAAELIGRVR